MEGPTSSGGSRNRLTCLTLQEHDDDDDSCILLVSLSSTYVHDARSQEPKTL